MNFFACVLLLVVSSTAQSPQEKDDLSKRGLEHRNNLALLTSIHLGENKSLNALSPNPATIETPISGPNTNIQPDINLQGISYQYPPENSPPAAPPQLTNELSLGYAPAHRFSYVNPPVAPFENPIPPTNNFVHFSYENAPFETGTNLVTNNHLGPFIPQETPLTRQSYQYQLTKELPYPQPYPVNIIRTVQVPVQVRVPVEVPRPYEVRVPHPVPVPVHIRVPVPVAKPYPVQVTKTVAVPVEKPVYIRVPQPVEVPVPQPYPVGVPQPVQIRVPVVVRIADGVGNGLSSNLVNLDGTPFIPSAHVTNINIPRGPLNIPEAPVNIPEGPLNIPVGTVNLQPTPPLPVTPPAGNQICSTCNKVVPTSTPPLSVTSSRPAFTGNGLLPPPPPPKVTGIKSVIGGLLNSYVASKAGGVYRRSTKYQTAEYHKTW